MCSSDLTHTDGRITVWHMDGVARLDEACPERGPLRVVVGRLRRPQSELTDGPGERLRQGDRRRVEDPVRLTLDRPLVEIDGADPAVLDGADDAGRTNDRALLEGGPARIAGPRGNQGVWVGVGEPAKLVGDAVGEAVGGGSALNSISSIALRADGSSSATTRRPARIISGIARSRTATG